MLAPGCLSKNPKILNYWDKIEFLGPKVFVYFKSGLIVDYKSDCIYVMKLSPVPNSIKLIIPKKEII